MFVSDSEALHLYRTGEINGAGMYASFGGRFRVSSTVTHSHAKSGRVGHRVWTATDTARRDPSSPRYNLEVARATTLAVCKARLAKYIIDEGLSPIS
jgi:hypothetical protein